MGELLVQVAMVTGVACTAITIPLAVAGAGLLFAAVQGSLMPTCWSSHVSPGQALAGQVGYVPVVGHVGTHTPVAAFAGSGSPQSLPDAIRDVTPHGHLAMRYAESYEVTPEQWVLGHHPEATADELQSIHQVCKDHNDINPKHGADIKLTALQPALYRHVVGARGVSTFITSPWFAVLDIVLPLLVELVPVVAFVHVPMHYLLDAHNRRTAFLNKLQDAGRLMVVGGLPRGPLGRRCVWLCCFKHKQHRELAESQVYRSGRQLMPMHIISNDDVEWAQQSASTALPHGAPTVPQSMAVLSVDC